MNKLALKPEREYRPVIDRVALKTPDGRFYSMGKPARQHANDNGQKLIDRGGDLGMVRTELISEDLW